MTQFSRKWVFLGFLALLFTEESSMWSCLGVQKEIEFDEEQFLSENGSRLLEELIKSCNGKSNPIRIFSAKELESATKNYDQGQILRRDYFYVLYKGTHQNRIISVKKYEHNNVLYIRWCINEIVIASQMNHINVLKLLGCCLETEIPILVYEYTGNGNLCDHIFTNEGALHPSENRPPLSWMSRLRIATEIAAAITYLHMATSMPIIHRSIRGPNILIDQHYIVKLSGFECSIPIPVGETYVEADQAEAIGFLAPESIVTNQFTEKNDVYSFGAILLEIITGKSAKENSVMLNSDQGEGISTSKGCSGLVEDEERNEHPLSPMDKLLELYLKANILKEGNTVQLMACGELSLRCLKENPEERPTIKEVTQELRQIKKL